MNHTALPLLACAAALTLAACGQSGPVAGDASNSAALPDPADVGGSEVGTASADGSPPTNTAAPGGRAPLTMGDTATPTQRAIPAALQGRWGMTPADCTSTRGDAKGLLVISETSLRFYESTATPARNVKTAADMLSADFDFTGEGQSWTKFETLKIDADKLIRTESSPMASFTYVRCR